MNLPKNLTDYDTFYSELMERYDAMAAVARDKLNMEKLSLPGWIPFWGDDLGDAEIAGAGDKLSRFASTYCYGNYNDLKDIHDDLEIARINLNGREPPNAAPDDIEGIEGIEAEVGEINAGLASWQNSTADTFREKYVNSIGQRKTNQFESIGKSQKAVQSAMDILVETRKVALTLPNAAKAELEGYSPVTDTLIGSMTIAFNTIGVFANVGKAALCVVALETLPEESGLSVDKLMNSFESAVDQLRKKKVKGEREVGKLLDDYLADEEKNWSNFVCSRPASVA